MTDARPGGKRRSDRVLAQEFVADVAGLTMQDLRERRRDAEQVEVDLSYVRRLLQGRIDIARAEGIRRRGGADRSLVGHLAEVLAEGGSPAPAHGLGRHMVVEPSRAEQRRRRVELLLDDVDLSNVASQTDDELQSTLARFTAEERDISRERHAVQHVMDLLSAEIGRRYRDGEADVSSLLSEEQR